jgi:probable F420-dependent oxidoreductase
MTTASSFEKPARRLGRVGVWSGELRYGEPGARAEAAAELDAMGYGAIWIPGGVGGPLLADIRALLDAAPRAAAATGIINIWKHTPAEIGAWWRELPAPLQARTLLGLGVSHGPLIGAEYGKPLATMTAFLDGLDAEGVPRTAHCIAALAPKMLDLSRDRSAGTHPYLVPPEHTAIARKQLGPDALVAPEQGVILETDPGKAREIGRQAIKVYLGLPNYLNNWRRLGYSEEDVTTFSDRLHDAIFAWGAPQKIAERVKAHFDAGADHVCLQVLRGATGGDNSLPMREWKALAEATI